MNSSIPSTGHNPSSTESPDGKVACTECSLYRLCLPVGIDENELAELDRIIRRRRPIARGEHVFVSGDAFRSIYAVRSGSLKTYRLTEDGREMITGFFLPGELIGLDAIDSGQHLCAARALETTSLCEIPFDEFESMSQHLPTLSRQLVRVMSREMHHDQLLLMLLGKHTAEERLAAFLLSLSIRYGQRGYSSTEFNLSMPRSDIGSYLGLAVETVSRLFSRLQEDGILTARGRHIRLIDLPRLELLAGA